MADDMIFREDALKILDTWIDYYERILELTKHHEENSTTKHVKSVIKTLQCISEEIEEA